MPILILILAVLALTVVAAVVYRLSVKVQTTARQKAKAAKEAREAEALAVALDPEAHGYTTGLNADGWMVDNDPTDGIQRPRTATGAYVPPSGSSS